MSAFKFFYRVVYGNQLAYPANDVAKRFAALMNVRTFGSDQIRQIGELGFSVQNVRDPATATLIDQAGAA